MKIRISVLIGLILVSLIAGAALLASQIAPYSPFQQNLANDLLAPSQEHLLGTDKLGRDVWTRTLYGARISLAVGITAVTLSVLIGFSIGALSGYFGGWVDGVLMRLTDVLMAFPGILLAISLAAFLGPGLQHVILALCLSGWTGYARLVRGEILTLREREFIHAARSIGCGPARIIFRHLLPNILSPLIVQGTFGMATAIMAEGGLSFLGIGTPPPVPSWGSMLSEGRQFILIAPHLTTFPGLAIMVTVLALNLIGDGLRDGLEKAEKR